MTFDQYLTGNNIKQVQAATDLGVSEGRVSQLRAGESPSFALAQRIWAWSGGRVDVLGWGAENNMQGEENSG